VGVGGGVGVGDGAGAGEGGGGPPPAPQAVNPAAARSAIATTLDRCTIARKKGSSSLHRSSALEGAVTRGQAKIDRATGRSVRACSGRAPSRAQRDLGAKSGASRAPLGGYWRSEPEKSLLHQAIRERLEPFLASARERSTHGHGLALLQGRTDGGHRRAPRPLRAPEGPRRPVGTLLPPASAIPRSASSRPAFASARPLHRRRQPERPHSHPRRVRVFDLEGATRHASSLARASRRGPGGQHSHLHGPPWPWGSDRNWNDPLETE
jgi:hypothetical protein